MKAIARFYTLFWMIYFPVCLAFKNRLTNEFYDELLCIFMMLFGFLQWKLRAKSTKMEREMLIYILVIVGYFVYSLSIQITTTRGILLDLLQQLRPYMVFYMTWFMAPQFSKFQKKLIVGSTVITMVTYFLLGNNGAIVSGRYEDGILPMIALTTGMIYYLFTASTSTNKWIAIAIMLVGLFSGKSKYMGQCLTFIMLVMFVKNKINYKSAKTYLALGVLVSVVVFSTWAKFNKYYVEGMSAEAEGMARPLTYKVAYKQILWDYFPLGSGLGTFGTAAAAKEYSPLYYVYNLDQVWGLSPDNPMFLADCFYPTLAEFGVVGIILFIIFWSIRLRGINTIRDRKNYQMALMAVAALAIDSTANTGYLSGDGMGLFMTLAFCLQSNRNMMLNRHKRTWASARNQPSINSNNKE